MYAGHLTLELCRSLFLPNVGEEVAEDSIHPLLVVAAMGLPERKCFVRDLLVCHLSLRASACCCSRLLKLVQPPS
jgi:hypothetical protein